MKRLLFFLILQLTTPAIIFSQNPHLIIFVHGTIKPAEFSFSSIMRIMRDDIENCLYSKALEYIRKDPFFFQGQALQQLGLVPITLSNETAQTTCAHCVAKLFEMQYVFYQKNNESRLYYTFGWNGLLNSKERLKEGINFYKALSQEVTHFQTKGFTPKISIIGYSHGGNVALNLVQAKKKFPKKTNFVIDELILLGMPVQKTTDFLVADPLFKKTYHIYSTEDQIQTMDIFTTKKHTFSKRMFTHHKNFQLPENLTQVRIRITKKAKCNSCLYDNTEDAYEILGKKKTRLIHNDPGHVELWNFEWGAYWYRPTFTLKPFSILTFIPSITHFLELYAQQQPLVTFDYCPSLNGARITLGNKKNIQAVPVLNQEIIDIMRSLAESSKPLDFNITKQHEQVCTALRNAQQDLKKNKKTSKKKHHKEILMSYLSRSTEIRAHAFPEF